MRAAGAGRGESGLMVTGAFDGRVLVDELGAWTQQSKMEAEGRKEADSAPILINGVFSAVPDAGLRTAAPSLGPNVGISKSSWDDLAPGLARRETVSSVEEVEKSRRRAGPWRQTKGRTKPLGGRRPRAPRVHHHRALRPGSPECPRWPTQRRCFQVPQDAWSRRPRRSKTAECDRGKAHRQVGASILFLCWLDLALSIGHIGKALGPPKTKVTIPFAIPTAEMPGRRHAEPWGPFVCQQQKKGRVMAFWAWHGLSISPRP